MSSKNTSLIRRNIFVTLISMTIIFAGLLACSTLASDDDQRESQRLHDLVSSAEQLGREQDKESFESLLSLLTNDHPDVSYAAAIALEKRAQKKWSNLFITELSHFLRSV